MPDTPQKLIETVREKCNALDDIPMSQAAWNLIDEIRDTLASLESALGEKTVPLTMLWELFRAATAPNHIPYSKRAELIVSKYMLGYTVK
jgi:hypothetical protein